MDALSLTLRSVTSSKAAQIKRQETHFKEERLSLQSILDREPNGNKRLKAILKTYFQLPLMPQTNTSRDKFIATVKNFLERTIPDPCAPIAQWERRLIAIIDSQCLRYEHANLYTDILKEWRDSTDEPEKLIDDSSFEVEDLCQSKDEYRQEWENYVFNAVQTDKDAIVKWLQGVFASTQASTKALEDLRAGVALFERTMKENKGHFTKSSMNWCIWGLLRSDLLTDEKRRVLTVIQQDEDALQDVIDDLNMRMNTLDQWAWPTEGIVAEQRRQVGSKYRIFHDEDLIDALLLRYVGVKWSVQMSERLVAFAKAHTWLSPLNTVSRNDRTRRDHFLGPTTDHSAGVQGQRLKTFEDDFFLAQLLRHEKEVDRGYEDDFEQEDRNRGLQTRQSITELKHSLLQLLNVEITVRKRLDDEVTVVQSDFKAFGTSIPHTTISAVLTFFGVSQSWTEFIIKALAVPIVFREDGPEAEVRKRRRGTHMSSPLADFCSELLMFGMDFAVWQCTSGLRLYRLHDDFWLWGSEDACVRGWSDMADFAKVMGLAFNAEKSGSIRVSRTTRTPLNSSLPRGDVSWGFLKLSSSGYFVLDNALLDKHITALIAQLASSKSLFAWIRIWNTYGIRYFMSMLGGERPASCLGAQHIALMQQCFARMHQKVFQDEANVANYIRKEIKRRFPSFSADVLDSFIFLPVAVGGLDVKNPFVTLTQLEGRLPANPEVFMHSFIQAERNSYQKAKALYEQGRTVGLAQSRYTPRRSGFFSFQELVRARDQLSHDLLKAYQALLDRPKPIEVVLSDEVEAVLGGPQGLEGSYDLCLLELYKDELVANFGGLNIVETRIVAHGNGSNGEERKNQVERLVCRPASTTLTKINANFHPRSTPVNSTSAHRRVKRVETLSYADAVCKGRLLWANVQSAFNGQRAPGREFGQAEFDEAWSLMPTEGRPSPVGQHWEAAFRDFVANPPPGLDVLAPERRFRKFPTQSKRFFNNAGRPVEIPTEGHYDITYVPVCAAMIATTALSPSASIADTEGSPYGHPVDARDVPNIVPPMHRFSDLAWYLWTQATFNRGLLRYIGHDFILSEDSMSIMDHIAVIRFGNADVNLSWPGLSYGIETDEAKALLAVPNGVGVAYIMMDRAGWLGRRQPSVHIFKNDRGKWCMLWDLAPA